MTEREKMLAGVLYDASDPDLRAARLHARRWMARYNASTPDDLAARFAMLAEVLGSVGLGTHIEPPFSFDYGSQIHLGPSVFMNFGCVVLDCARVTIGRGTAFGPGVQILTAHHPIDPRERAGGPELASPVEIGEDVWIGGGAIILPGVTIGAGTTIGAGSVVTRSMPAGVVAYGNPCRVARRAVD